MSHNRANDQRTGGRGTVKGRRRRSIRPTVMALEDRRLLATFTVNLTTDTAPTTGGSGSGNSGDLRYCITQADANNQANTIVFDSNVFATAKTITLGGSQLELSDTGGTQTITGPAAGVTISGGGRSRVFQVDGGVTASISGLTIAGGTTTGSGGGLYNQGETTLSDCTVSGDTASNDGGGIYNEGGATATLTGLTVSGDSAGMYGGGLENQANGTMVVSNSTFSSDSATIRAGGGINNDGSITVTTSTFETDHAGSNGGGYSAGGAGTITDCTFLDNVSANAAGGAYAGENNTTLNITDCTFVGNTATTNGGGVANNGVTTLTACTFTGNSASTDGGGINASSGSSTTLLDTIVAGNSAGSSGDISSSGGTISGSNNLIGTGGSGGLTNGTNHNIVLTSLANLGVSPLGSYGGQTQTVALLPGSVALGAGAAADYSGTNNLITTDQRGEPLDSPNPDIGAFQSQGFSIVAIADSTPQKTPIDDAFANPLAVTVTANNPVEPVTGGIVTFAVPSSGASAVLSGTTATIQAGGTASVTATANSILGSYSVTAASAGSGSASFSLTNLGVPTVTVTDAGGTYTGSPFPATATVAGTSGIPSSSLEGVTPTLTYYAGSTASGTPLAGAPSSVGSYTVVANFPGSTDYEPATSSPVTFAITKATPGVSVTDAGGTYNGSAFPATASVTGVSGIPSSSLEGVTPTLTYYAGSTATGTPLAGAPTVVGSYTVVANFPGSADYAANSSSGPAFFAITNATPVVTVTDAGGTYNGSSFPATASVTGVSGPASSSLEGVTPTLTYYAGSTAAGTPLAGAPIAEGAYTVVASFAGSADYGAAASAPATFTITSGAPVVNVTDAGGTYNGSSFPATASVTGTSGIPSSSLEGVTPTLTYYAGSTPISTPLAGAPTAVGSYTVVANFPGSADYGPAASAPVTFVIAKATPAVTVTDAGGAYHGAAFPASAAVTGVSGPASPSLEGVTPSLTYYTGSTATGTPLAGAPSSAGTYTVVASFAGSTDYGAASSAPATFAIAKATPVVTVTDAGGTFTGAAFPASAAVTGTSGPASSSLEGVTPTLAYYAGSTASGTPLAAAPSSAGTYTVVASFAGSTDYGAASSAPATFAIAKATPVVTVTDAGGTFTGAAFPASASITGVSGPASSSLEGVTPTLTYYAGSTATGTPLAAAPSAIGTYTVVAGFAGSADYSSATSAPATFAITDQTAVVTVADAGGRYNGSPFPATASVAGTGGTPSASLEGETPTVAYYAGSTATGSPLAGAPSLVGTYTVVANFPGSAHYGPVTSAPATFAITNATPTVTVTDAGGTYWGEAFPASAAVTGVSGPASFSLEGEIPTLAYYAGSTATGTPLAGAPTLVGTYTVVATFPGSYDYTTAASAPVTFTIAKATPVVSVTDTGGTYNGSVFPASDSVAGVSGRASSSLEGAALTLGYYAGSTASGTPLSGAPSSAGKYTVVATFPGSANYAVTSTSATFTVMKATSVVTVSAPGGVFDGSPFPASAMIAGLGNANTPAASLEDVTPAFTYYDGSGPTRTAIGSTPPTVPGTYTVVADFPGSTDYAATQAAPVTFTIAKASPQVGLSASAGSTVYGQTVSFVATVTAAGGAPTGTVTFSAGGKTLGTVAVDGLGTATLSTSSLAIGSYAVTATYNGTTDLATATSGSVSESVAKAATQVVFVPPVRKVKKAGLVGLEVEVEPLSPGAGVPTGTVTLEVNHKTRARAIGAAASSRKTEKVIGTVSLSDGEATLELMAMCMLKKSISVVYSGDADYLSSTETPPPLTHHSLKSLARPMSVFLQSKSHHHRVRA